MSRLILLISVLPLFSCSVAPAQSGLYSESDNVLTDRRREMYFDDNNSRRGRTVCEYRDGSTVTVAGGYNCPPVYPGDD